MGDISLARSGTLVHKAQTFGLSVKEVSQEIKRFPQPMVVDARPLGTAGVRLRRHLLENGAPAARQGSGERAGQQPCVQRRQVLV